MVRAVKRRWRRFYKRHRVAVDFIGDFLGTLSIFVFLYFMYIVLWMLGGN